MKKPSLLNHLIFFAYVMVLLPSVLLAVYLFTSHDVLTREETQEVVKQTDIYSLEIQNRLEQMDQGARELLLLQYNNLLILKSPMENQRFYASQSVFRFIRDMLADGHTGIEGLVVADMEYDICLDCALTSLNYWDRTSLRDYTKKLARTQGLDNRWQYAVLNGKDYIYRAYQFDGRAVAFYLQARDLMGPPPGDIAGGLSFALAEEDGTIISLAGNESLLQLGGNIRQMPDANTVITESRVADGFLTLYAVSGGRSFLTALRGNMAVVLLVILFTLVFSLILALYIRRNIYGPMKAFQETMDGLQRQDYDVRVTQDFGTREFDQLKTSFNSVMEELIHLKISRYEQIIALQDMELRSIRLQLRPHFFLNAITTISSLNMQNRTEEVRTYVDALSKNIRYMFRSGLHTVPVAEEIRHVENYFAMQECMYPQCIFHLIELEEGLSGWPVPQMIIQTIIENEYKYAVSLDEVLSILIRINRTEYKGEEMLMITIEDDGKGYPAEVLDIINSSAERASPDGQRVGLWSIRRTMRLMYDRDDLVQFSNIQPHGCMNTLYVPAHPRHEYSGQGAAETEQGGDRHEHPDRR